MKKFFFSTLLLALPLIACAYDVEIDGIFYNLKSGNNAEVTYKATDQWGYNSNYTGVVDIPEKISYKDVEYTVISVGDNAFASCTSLTSVTIPNTVTRIGNGAFFGCKGMIKVTIPNTITIIGDNAFWSCSSLTSVNIPNSINKIGPGTFYECRNLTSICFPNSLTSIGNCAFSYCESLTSISIPSSVKTIGTSVFDNCYRLESIIVESGNTVYDSRDNSNAIINSANNELICGCKNTIIPNTVNSIGEYAFYGCTGLTSVIIPNSVTSIGSEAFWCCSGLTSVIIPNSVQSIGAVAFDGCSSLVSIVIPKSVTSLGSGAFSGCSSLTSIIIPEGIRGIGDSTFYGCSSLTSVYIPNSVVFIDNNAFSGCSSLTSVSIPNSVTSMGYRVFKNCSSLIDVYCYAVNVPSTNSSAFENLYTKYMTLYVPKSAINDYKTTNPWSKFGTFVSIEDSGNENPYPETPKCETPSICFENKELLFTCSTEGVEYVSKITDVDIKDFYSNRISLSATYNISVYATKSGYENSDVATALLVWTDAIFTETTPETPTSAKVIAESIPVLISAKGGVITVKGEQEGQAVAVYTTDGKAIGSTTMKDGQVSITTNLQRGEIAVVKVGSKSVKIKM